MNNTLSPYEFGLARLNEIIKEVDLSKISNESETRLNLIDRIFFECLGWSRQDCRTEYRSERDIQDYNFSISRPMMIVEAKKISISFSLPVGERDGVRTLESVIKNNGNVRDAIAQAQSYASREGVEFSVATNGTQFVGFLSFSEGVDIWKSNGIVFTSLDSICENFKDFYQYFSKSGVEARRFNLLKSKRANPAPPKLSARIKNSPKARNSFQAEIQILSDLIFTGVFDVPEIEEEFLMNCYCDSGAISEYSLLSKQIVETRYQYLRDSASNGVVSATIKSKVGEENNLNPEFIIKGVSARPIILIGDVGAGKTTFIQNLATVIAKDEFEKAIFIRVDLGSRATLTQHVGDTVVTEIENQLAQKYDIDINDFSLIKSVHSLKIKNFEKGPASILKEDAPEKYAEAKYEFIQQLTKDKVEHLKAVSRHLVRGQKRDFIIFIDNCDQRDAETQEKAFLSAQEIAKTWDCLTFLALRPETYYRSILTKATLSGYNSNIYTISPPKVSEAIIKRLRFAAKIASGDIKTDVFSRYNIQLSRIWHILQATIYSINSSRELRELIENVSNGNTRMALDMVHQFLSSGHVDTVKISNKWEEKHDYVIPTHEFLRAIIFGDSSYYDPSHSVIANIFDINSPDYKEHFVLPGLLSYVYKYKAKAGAESGYVENSQIYCHLLKAGYSAEQVDLAFSRASKYNLIESISKETQGRTRITALGAYHCERLPFIFAYIDAIVLDTPIIEADYQDAIVDSDDIRERLSRAKTFVDYLDQCWDGGSSDMVFDWPSCSMSLNKEFERIESVLNSKRR